MSGYILFLIKLKGTRPFFESAKRGSQREIIPKSTWLLKETKKVSPFVKFRIISPLLCYLLDLFTNKYIRVWSSMKIFVDRFQDLSKTSCYYQGEGLPKENVSGNIILTIHYLKVLHGMVP